MKVLKCLIVFSMGILMFSCTSEESNDMITQSSDQEISTRNVICDPEPVNYTVNSSSITVNSLINSNVNFIAVHKAADFSYVEALCDFWNGGAPDCGANLTSGTLPDGDYLLKASTSTGFCWIEFTIPGGTPELVVSNSSNGTIYVTSIDPSVVRLDIHNLDFSVATPVSAICSSWGTACTAPISTSGFTTGNRLLRIEQSDGTVTFEDITIN